MTKRGRSFPLGRHLPLAFQQEDQLERNAGRREPVAGGEPEGDKLAHLAGQALPEAAGVIDEESAALGIALTQIAEALLGGVQFAP